METRIGLLSVIDQDMEAWMILKEPNDGMYTTEEVIEVLNENRITHGIDRGVIDEILREEKYGENICIAKGQKPTEGEDGYFELLFSMKKSNEPKVREDGSVDYYDMENIITVEAGKEIVHYHPAKIGVYGYTVKGTLLTPVKKGKDLTPLLGKGFTLSEDKLVYTADLSGQVIMKDAKHLEVCDVLKIAGNVDPTVGNLVFAGSISIAGDVLSGFKVIAEKNISIGGHVESAFIKAGQDVVIKGGMNGQPDGVVQAGGSVQGKYFENATIISAGNISANYLINCEAHTEGKVVISGNKGVIVGGITKAVQGIDCYYVGNISEINTVVGIGAGHEVYQRQNQVEQKLTKLNRDLKILQKGLEGENEAKAKLHDRIQAALEVKLKEKAMLEEEQNHLNTLIEQAKVSRLTVSGYIYPGVIVLADLFGMQVHEKLFGAWLGVKNDGIVVNQTR